MPRPGRSFPPSSIPRPAPARPVVDDLWPRLVLNPIFGIVIPTITGLISPRTAAWRDLVVGYAWFVAVAFILWEGNRRLYLRLVWRYDWCATPWRRVLLIGGLALLYTVPAATLLLGGWAVIFDPPGATPARLASAVAVTTACVLFVVHVYETVFLLRDWESDRLRNERLERQRIEAELDALRNQVEPHFLFNALNSLAYLVEHDRRRALRFIDALGEVLRYIVSARGQAWVTLDEELTFIGHYMTLVGLRYGESLRLEIAIDRRARSRWMVLPASLQGLVENAVKHNDVTKASFVIRILLERDTLEVRNPLAPRAQAPRSTGTGLANLAERTRLALGVPVTWAAVDGEFVVRVPLRRVQPRDDSEDTGSRAADRGIGGSGDRESRARVALARLAEGTDPSTANLKA